MAKDYTDLGFLTFDIETGLLLTFVVVLNHLLQAA